MLNIKKKKFFLIFIPLSSIVIFFLNFYFREFLASGSQTDFNSFVFNNIQLFKNNFITSLENYGKLKDASWPFFYIFHAFLNPFSSSVSTYLVSSTFIGFSTFIILIFSVKNTKFNLLESICIASIILLFPWFNGRAHWGTSANLGWFFLVVTFYFYTRLKFLNMDNKQKQYNLFFLCFFSAISLYIRPAFIFFSIFFSITYLFSDENLKSKFFIILCYVILSLPGIYLIYLWGGIYDHKNSEVVLKYHEHKNILKNVPIIFNFFFFYYWPLYLFYIFDKGLKIFLKNYFLIFIILLIFFLTLQNLGYINYLSNYGYGGGVILKLGYLLNDKYNFIFLISSAFGGSFIFGIIKEDYKNNLLLIFIIFIIFGFPKFLYQDYLEPLIYLLLFNGILNSSLINLQKKYFTELNIFFFLYFSFYNMGTILYRININ